MFARAHPYTRDGNPRASKRDETGEPKYRFEKEKRITYESTLSPSPSYRSSASGPFHPLLPPCLGKQPRSSRLEGLSRISIPLLFLFFFSFRVLSSLSTCVPLFPRLFRLPSSRTSPLEVVAPSGSPNLPTDPHDSAPGIMGSCPEDRACETRSTKQFILSLWYSWIAGALCWPFLPLLSWSSWPLPLSPSTTAHLPPTAIFSPEVNLVFIVLVSRRTSSSGANGYRDVLITRLPIAGLSFPLIIPILTTCTSRTGILFCLHPSGCSHLNSWVMHDKSLRNPTSSQQVYPIALLTTELFSLYLLV